MVSNTIHGTYTETYDLNTAIGELSMLAIHTPQAQAVKKMFKGLFENYSKYKILGCNLRMVCASQQALDPSQIGLEAGQVDPRDVLNPILFKACTGESINKLVDTIYTGRVNDVDTTTENARSISQVTSSRTEAVNSYYQMMADDSWRKSHPQSGLTVMGLRPFVHKVVTTQPFKWVGTEPSTSTPEGTPAIAGNQNIGTSSSTAYGFGSPGEGLAGSTNYANPSVFISNGVTEMPWLETTVTRSVRMVKTGLTSTDTELGKWTINHIPRVYMGCIILPPAILQRLFFRMQITWHIMFKDFRPAYEIGPVDGINPNNSSSTFVGAIDPDVGIVNNDTTYWNMYHNATPSKVVVNEHSSFTTTEKTEVEVLSEKVA